VHEAPAETGGKIIYGKLAGRHGFCDCHRPHGTLGGQTPYERLRGKTTTANDPE